MARPISIDTGIKERLLQFIEFKGLNKHRFEVMCGFTSRYISNIRKSISQRSLKTISCTFPDLNIRWLETGEGQMLNEVIPINVQNNTVGNNSSQTIVAGNDNNVTISDKNRQLLESIQKMCDENAALKTENTELKIKVDMLTEQIEWLRTMVKQQNQQNQ